MIQDLSIQTIKTDFWAECDTILSHEITLIVPVINGHTNLVNKITDTFCGLFGGCTVTKAKGFYASNRSGIIKDNVTLINVSCIDLEKLAIVYGLAIEVKTTLQQESVAVKVDGKLYLV